MSFVNGSEIFSAARKGHYAVGAFNTNNLEWTRAILKGAQEKNVPVLIQVSMGAAKYMGGYKLVRDLVASEMESMNITVPVVMHLDHGNYEAAKECIEAGFSSVMFDGHDLPFEENLAKTKEIVELAHAKGISVEAEVGSIGQGRSVIRRTKGETLGTGQTDYGSHEGMDGSGRRQVQPQVTGRQSHHICLYTMGQYDEVPGRRMSAVGQQPGGKCHPAHHVGAQELPLLRQPRGGR